VTAIAALAIVGARLNRIIESQGAITVVQPDAGDAGIRLLYTDVFSGYQPQLPM
jgi:hypothetical protein